MSSSFTRLVLPVFFILLAANSAIAQLDCVNNPTYADPPAASFFNTGTDGAGGTLPVGSNDLNWTMSTTSIAGPYSPAIVMGPLPAVYYNSPWPDCAWISHNIDGSHVGNLDVWYKFSFSLACGNACHQSYSDPGTFCLNLDFFADNSVYEIIVNGVVQSIPGIPVANPYFYQGYIQANMVTVSLCNDWHPGSNDLVIHVVSGPPYEGFLAQASTNVPPPISDTVSATICQGQSYIFGPNTLTTAGTYTHTFASQTGCDSLVTLLLSVNPSYNTTTIDTICKGDSVLFAGTYYKTAGLFTHSATTTLGCDSTTRLQLTVITTLATAAVTNVLCNGDATGAITMNAANNPAGYTYANGAGPYGPSNIFSGLTAGTYTIHTKAPFGCIKDTVLTITQPSPLTFGTLTTVTPLCNGGSGTFTVAGSGGKPNYTYAIDAGPYTINTNYSASAGSHTLHIKDANGCTKDSTVTMTEPTTVHGTAVITNEPCYGQTLGSITLTGNGGVAPYTYALGAASYGAGVFSGLAAGTYTVHVRDANNCIFDTTVIVTQPPSLGATLDVTYPKCFGDSNGSIVITPNGGTQPFSYTDNGGAPTANNVFGNLPASINSIEVTDQNGCKIDTTVYLTEPSRIRIADMQLTNVRCAGGYDGVIQTFVLGGVPTYLYAVDQLSFSASNEMTGLNAGQHTVHIKDMKGCTIDSVVEIKQPPVLGFSNITTTNVICEGDKNGTVMLEGTGGTPAYMYSANDSIFKTKNLFDGFDTGTYTFYIQDSLGCEADTTVTVGENPRIVITAATVTTPTCFGTGDGTITINATGGVAPLRYQVDGQPSQPISSNLFTNMGDGTHTITVTDDNNCKKSSLTSVHQPGQLALRMQSNGNLCEGVDNNGAVYVDVKGGTPPYKYTWSSNPMQVSYQNGITGLPNGKYSVHVADAHDCMAFGEAVVEYDHCCTPYVPNAFTPNGDGKNDFFHPVFKGNMLLDKMTIFNRYGQVIFSTTNIMEGWDGTYKGVPQDIGTYYYFIEFYCGQQDINKQIQKGDVTLVR